MKIQPIPHKTLSGTVASKLAASLLDGSLSPGTQLPSERELMNQFGVSRTTVREALKSLEEYNLIESRPNVGWFVREIGESNITQAKELAAGHTEIISNATNEPVQGPSVCLLARRNLFTSPTCRKTAWALSSSFPGGNVKRFKRQKCW